MLDNFLFFVLGVCVASLIRLAIDIIDINKNYRADVKRINEKDDKMEYINLFKLFDTINKERAAILMELEHYKSKNKKLLKIVKKSSYHKKRMARQRLFYADFLIELLDSI